MPKVKVTRQGSLVLVQVPLFHSAKRTDEEFAKAISQWTSKGYRLLHNSRMGSAGGVLTFEKGQ